MVVERIGNLCGSGERRGVWWWAELCSSPPEQKTVCRTRLWGTRTQNEREVGRKAGSSRRMQVGRRGRWERVCRWNKMQCAVVRRERVQKKIVVV